MAPREEKCGAFADFLSKRKTGENALQLPPMLFVAYPQAWTIEQKFKIFNGRELLVRA